MRWGLVGTGPWAAKVHAPSLASHPDVEFACVWGRDVTRAAELGSAHGAQAIDSYDEFLTRCDAVSFAVAPAAQAALALRALKAGKHVLLEKPVATDVPAAVALRSAIATGSSAVVFLTRIFDPARSAWLRDAMRRDYRVGEARWVSAALTSGSPFADSAWRHGVGVVWDVMPHILSQLTPVLGPVESVDVQPWPEQEGWVFAFTHPAGRRSTARVTLRADPADKAEWIRFSAVSAETVSPATSVDSGAAHSGALDFVLAGSPASSGALLASTTLVRTVSQAAVMADMAAQIEAHLVSVGSAG